VFEADTSSLLSSIQARKETRLAIVEFEKAQTVASSQLQLDSSMHAPFGLRTAGLSSQEIPESL